MQTDPAASVCPVLQSVATQVRLQETKLDTLQERMPMAMLTMTHASCWRLEENVPINMISFLSNF